jgi:hypothetical protein
MTNKPEPKTRRRTSLFVISMAMCAALYAVGSYLTAYIPSPWGGGQFRPAVIIPAFFATIFGGLPAGIGAALGTLIADSVKHGYLYPGSYLAAVPGNFIGFYLFGYIVKKKFTWGRFIIASNVTLTLANLIVAFLYVFAFKVLYANTPQYTVLGTETLVWVSIGLTIWWFVTMLPFVLLVTPLLIRATALAVPYIVPEDVRTHSLKAELPKTQFSLAMLVPGIIMIILGLATTYTAMGDLMSQAIPSTVRSITMAMIQLLFYGSGVVLFILGLMVLAGKKVLWQSSAMETTKEKKA